MRFSWLCRLVVPGLMALLLAGPVHAQPPSPFVPGPWWKNFQKTLALTADQSSRIEAVFQEALPYLRHKRDELERQEAELSRLIKEDADDALIEKQSDRVESVRTALNKRRTIMLVRMRSILTPEQRAKLNAIRDQWDRDHSHPSPSRPRTSNAPK